MDIKVFHCRTCYADLTINNDDERILKCPYCGCTNVIDYQDDFLKQAIEGTYRYIRNADFEEANENLANLIKKYPDEAELYFMKVLVDSKIIYVDDGEKKIPTYTNVNFDIDSDQYINKSLELARYDEQRAFFNKQYDIIKEDKAAILKLISDNDKKNNFDVFISFKKTSLNDGKADTKEAKIAEEVYIHLLKEHRDLNVFYAPRTLKTGENWERSIFNALYRSKCLIVIGSKQENLNAPWVKNEWNRYLEMMKAGKKKENSIIPITVEGDPYDVLPSKLRFIQSLPSDIHLLLSLSKKLNEIFKVEDKKPQSKEVTIKHFEEYHGEKIASEIHDHTIDPSISRIEKLAKTDIDLAKKELEKLNQEDQKVKELRFKLTYRNYLAEYIEDETFFEEQSKIITTANVGDTISPMVNGLPDIKSGKNPSHITLFCLKYIENLNEKDKKTTLKTLYDTMVKYFDKKIGSYNEKALQTYDEVVNAFLGIESIGNENKKQLLFAYCSYLLSIEVTKPSKGENNEEWLSTIFYPLIKKINYYLDYLEDSPKTNKDSKFFLNWMDFNQDSFAHFIGKDLSLRKMIYAKMLGLSLKVEKLRCSTISTIGDILNLQIEIINRSLSECQAKELKTIAALNYYLMRTEFRKIIISNNKDNSKIDEAYKNCQYSLAELGDDFNGQYLKGIYKIITDTLTEYRVDLHGWNYFKNPYKEIKIYKQTISDIEAFDPLAASNIKWVIGFVNKQRKAIKESKNPIETYLTDWSYPFLRNAEADDEVVEIAKSKKDTSYIETMIGLMEKDGENKYVIDKYINAIKDFQISEQEKAVQNKKKAIFFVCLTAISLLIVSLCSLFQFFSMFKCASMNTYCVFSSIHAAFSALIIVIDHIDYGTKIPKCVTRLFRKIYMFFSICLFFFTFMHLDGFTTSAYVTILVANGFIILIENADSILTILRADNGDSIELPEAVLIAEQALSFILFILLIIPFLINNFSLSNHLCFYTEEFYNSDLSSSLGFYFLAVLLGMVSMVTQTAKFYSELDDVGVDEDIGIGVSIGAGVLITLVMSVACVFMYFTPVVNLFAVIAFSAISFLPLIGLIIASVAVSI